MEHQIGMTWTLVTDVAVTRDGSNIISSYYDGAIKVWDVESHELVKEWTHPEGYTITTSEEVQHID